MGPKATRSSPSSAHNFVSLLVRKVGTIQRYRLLLRQLPLSILIVVLGYEEEGDTKL